MKRVPSCIGGAIWSIRRNPGGALMFQAECRADRGKQFMQTLLKNIELMEEINKKPCIFYLALEWWSLNIWIKDNAVSQVKAFFMPTFVCF